MAEDLTKYHVKKVKAPPEVSNAAGRVLDDEVLIALMEACVQLEASDLHLTTKEPPVFRRHGKMYRVDGYKILDHEDMMVATNFFVGEDDPGNRYWQRIHESGGADIAYALEGSARFRVSIFMQKGSPAIALRMIPTDILTFEQLGLPVKQVQEMLHRPRGIILLTGPTGCGKTTTIASMIDYINRERDTHIITIEDPIEYYHEGKRSLINQREVGVDVSSFAEAVVRNMRSDPDVMLVGEMRDLETMRSCLQAAETGHLVLSTLHTNDAPSSITRLINIGIEPYLIAASVNAVLAQRLVRRICEHCKSEEKTIREADARYLARHNIRMDKTYRGSGCDKCRGTGYSGRVGIYEMLELDDDLRDLVTASPSLMDLRRACRKQGMQTLREDGLAKVAAGLTTVEEIARVTET